MKDADLIQKWLTQTPNYEAVDVVSGLLVRAFGEDAICRGTGDSHQLRVKHPALANMSGFGPFGHLSVPVDKGQRVKGYYLKRIAQAIKRLEEVACEGEGK
jgi:hypothetical protein